jgi:hypothetical protein
MYIEVGATRNRIAHKADSGSITTNKPVAMERGSMPAGRGGVSPMITLTNEPALNQ